MRSLHGALLCWVGGLVQGRSWWWLGVWCWGVGIVVVVVWYRSYRPTYARVPAWARARHTAHGLWVLPPAHKWIPDRGIGVPPRYIIRGCPRGTPPRHPVHTPPVGGGVGRAHARARGQEPVSWMGWISVNWWGWW